MERTLPAIWAERASAHGDRPFVLFEGKVLTFGEMHQRSSRLAGALRELGVRPKDRVLVGFVNSPEIVETYAAINKAGACAVPVNPTYGVEELAYVVQDSGARLAVVQESLLPRFLQVRERTGAPDTAVVFQAEPGSLPEGSGARLFSYEEMVQHGPSVEESGCREEDVSVILYTSGTTGRPKGAQLTYRGLLFSHDSLADALRTGPSDRMLMVLPAYHLFFYLVGYVHMLAAGGSLVIKDHFHPRGMLEAVSRYRATMLAGVPSMYVLMNDVLSRESHDLQSLRVGMVAGAPMPPDAKDAFERASGAFLLEAYGMTEYGLATVEPMGGHRRYGSAGRAIPGVTLRIMDPETGAFLPPGKVGEIVLQHPGAMIGYWNRPDADAEFFRGGWLHTGDLGWLDDEGYLYVVDRLQDMIIFGGFNIYPKEVENVLYDHPAVLEAAVVGIRHRVKGEEPWAFIRLKEGATASARELIQHCRQRLAPYKVPRRVVFLEQLPKTPTGKVRKVELRARFGEVTSAR